MFLRRKLLVLRGGNELKRPRSSEGDSTTSEEIDVENDEETGYASCESEDLCSNESIVSEGSDGGLTVNTRLDICVSWKSYLKTIWVHKMSLPVFISFVLSTRWKKQTLS